MLTHCIDSRWKQTRFTSASPNEHEGSTTRSPFKKWLTLGPKIGRTFGLCTTHQILPARSTFRETLTIEGKTRSSLQASTKARWGAVFPGKFVPVLTCEGKNCSHSGSFTIYLKNRSQGAQAANEQVELLEAQKQRLTEEAQYLELRRRYVDIKIAYWKAVKSGDTEQREGTRERTHAIAQELQLPKQ